MDTLRFPGLAFVLATVTAGTLVACGSNGSANFTPPDGGRRATQDAGAGGRPAAGGRSGTGGSPSGGSAAGGSSSTGGTSGSGGSSSTGGSSAAGGSSSAGGTSSSGGSSGTAGAGGAASCVPSGTSCWENEPNANPLNPPNTPCCDGVCNHATHDCGCGGPGGPCSGLDILYGPDCCDGLICLDTGTELVCGTCHPDGAPCGGSYANCCSLVCNSITDTCGCSKENQPCGQDPDCCPGMTCGVDGLCHTPCLDDAQPCSAASQCCTKVCNSATSTCGCGGTGQSCKTTGDCCGPNPFCNSTSKCGCMANGTSCKAAADCCTGVCNAGTGACGCSTVGIACSSGADCCSGLTCGASKNCCKATGQACTSPSQCCSGTCKGNGSCG